ncbi:large conductance mechanosensitive channel protein MscL [Bacillus massilinigeriensis]|uniref:large conductance mechanosensitive channel protein MscL n=1 Tax=Bacillus massilionigeriensis TaxID=1805475 RepID=UPI00096AEE7A|nr:large conductance mechanosensitive channel protein MscL [Bacillus massilionigeriensis]
MWQEFKKFALKGNVIDLAIGVIIGGAFGKIVSSLVNDVIMPFIGLLLGGINFKKLEYPLGDALLKYGMFLQTVVDFLIIAVSLFIFVRIINRFKGKVESPQEAKMERQEELLTEIRDLLKRQIVPEEN